MSKFVFMFHFNLNPFWRLYPSSFLTPSLTSYYFLLSFLSLLPTLQKGVGVHMPGWLPRVSCHCPVGRSHSGEFILDR